VLAEIATADNVKIQLGRHVLQVICAYQNFVTMEFVATRLLALSAKTLTNVTLVLKHATHIKESANGIVPLPMELLVQVTFPVNPGIAFKAIAALILQ